MRYIHNPVKDPAFNLAAEEWLLTRSDEDVFMLWRNRPAVIVGRNQNTLAEIDEAFTRARDIPVVRRLSGGGAVFHDLGNINFTFITQGNPSQGLDFERFTAPIQQALGAMGVACEFSGRNDLLIDGKKFSGNAQHFHAGRILHHGTLLFASDMADLSGALRTDPEKYRDKAVKSVRSRVTNISSHLPAPMEVTAFIKALMDHVSGHTPMDDMVLSAEEQASIEELSAARYRTWEWNFGVLARLQLLPPDPHPRRAAGREHAGQEGADRQGAPVRRLFRGPGHRPPGTAHRRLRPRTDRP